MVFKKNLLYQYHYIGIGRYEKNYISILSVSADNKIVFIGIYWYWLIWKKAYRLYPGPDNWLQCSTSGDCIREEQRCDGYDHCDDGIDENPYKVIPFCCDTIVLSSNSDLVGKWHYKYMGVYVKFACSRCFSSLRKW